MWSPVVGPTIASLPDLHPWVLSHVKPVTLHIRKILVHWLTLSEFGTMACNSEMYVPMTSACMSIPGALAQSLVLRRVTNPVTQ